MWVSYRPRLTSLAAFPARIAFLWPTLGCRGRICAAPGGREPALTAFVQANKTAIEQFTGYLATRLREIRLVEYTFSNNPVTCDGKGPRAIMHTAQCLSEHPGVGAR